MSTPKQCPKCEGELVQGFVPDFGEGRRVTGWTEGTPKKSFWVGTKVDTQEVIPIGAFRCGQCGFLEFYAAKEFAAT